MSIQSKRPLRALPKRGSAETLNRRLELAAALRKCRLASGKTGTEAAVLAGVTFDTWMGWERARTAIPLERVPDIAKAIGHWVPASKLRLVA